VDARKFSKDRPPDPPGTILQPTESPIDLETAFRLAGIQNPEILLFRERVTEAAAARMFTAAQALPSINVGTSADMHQGALQQSNGNILKVNRDAMYFGLGANAIAAGSVNIPGLFYNLNIGVAWFNYLQARQAEIRSVAATRTAENDVLLRVALGYSELLRADAKRVIAAQNRLDAVEVARLTDAYVKAKAGRKADADRAAVELQKRDVELTQAEADTLKASARLCQDLNLDPSTRLKPIDGWVVPTPIVPDPISVSELIAIALMQRPELAERRAEIQEALYALSSAKVLPFSPNIILGFSNGGFGGGSNLITDGFIGGNGQPQSGPRFGQFSDRTDTDVVMFWTAQNLGVGNIAMVRGASSRVRQANWRQLETLNRVRAEVAESYAMVHARYAQIDTLAKAVKSSQEALEEDTLRIKGRQGLPIELIDSLRLLTRARNDYLDSIVDYNRSQFQLYVAMGKPPAKTLARPVPSDLVPQPKAPVDKN
jgi:outer membrane protein TolC